MDQHLGNSEPQRDEPSAPAARPSDVPPETDFAARALAILAEPALDIAFLRPTRVGVQSAWYGHVAFAHWLVAALRPRCIVELGTHNGVSYAAFCEAAVRLGLGARCAAIDTWQGDAHAGAYDDRVHDELRAFHDPRYGTVSELMRMTFDEARPFFAEGGIDLLHIDGLHTYDAVRHDWENWRSALSDRAVVLFHDTNEHKGSFGVWRLWDELRREWPSFTFLHGHGLGMLAVGSNLPEAIRALAAADATAETASRIRDRFAQIGERWEAHSEQVQSLEARRASESALAGLTNEVAALRESVHATTSRTEVAEQRLREANRELISLDDARDALQRTNARHAGLAAELAQVREQLASAHAALAVRASEWERVHGVIGQMRLEQTELQSRYDAILASASYQLAGPIRRLGRAVPKAATAAQKAVRIARIAASGHLAAHQRERARIAHDIEAIRSSGLFDPAFYLAQRPDLASSDLDPITHYVWTGAAEGLSPNAAFDPTWYRARHPELSERGGALLLHYARNAAAGAAPGPLFDPAWYVARHPDAASGALRHWLERGARSGVWPNAGLDAETHAFENVGAGMPGRDVLSDWVLRACRDGRDPHPLFDAGWYRSEHGLGPSEDPLRHWLERGARSPTSKATDRAASGLEIAPIPTSETPDVSIIIPAWGHLADTLRCLAALGASGPHIARFEVLVADDDPDHRIAPILAQRVTGVHLHENPTNLGFLMSCRAAVDRARGRVLLFLNNDTEVHPGWLDPLVELFDAHPDAGMVGCKLLNRDGTVQEAGGAIGRDGWGIPYGAGEDPAHPDVSFVREVDVVIGACFAIRRAAWNATGGFDPDFAPAFYEEFDLAFACRAAGWKVFYEPRSLCDHRGSNSYGAETRDRQSSRNHRRFCRKWASELHALPPPAAPALRVRSRPHDRRTILFIEDRVPEWDRHAGALTARQYMTLWQSLGFNVVFAPAADTFATEPYATRLRQSGIEVIGPPASLEAWIDANGGAVDLVWSARPDVTAPLISMLRARTSAPILYYPHDLHFLREARRHALDGDPWALRESERYERAERRIFALVDRVLAISEEEAGEVRALVPEADVRMIPPYLYPAPPPPPDAASFETRDVLVFVGGYVHPPNVDAARLLVSEIMPLVWHEAPEIRLVLAGSSPTAEIQGLAGSRIEVPGFVADLTPLHARTRLSVSPLRYGAGVKGKVVAALWEGLPCLVTSVANEGIGIVDGQNGFVADGAHAFARAILKAWHDVPRLARLGAAGQQIVRERFTEAAAARAMTAIVAAGRRDRTIAT